MRLDAKKLIAAMLADTSGAKLPTDAGVYAIVNTANQRVYIGSAINIRRRAIQHRSHLRAGTHSNQLFQSDWQSFGEGAFRFGALRLCHPWDRAIIEEKLTAQILGPNCYSWSSAGQRRRYLGHPAQSGLGVHHVPTMQGQQWA